MGDPLLELLPEATLVLSGDRVVESNAAAARLFERDVDGSSVLDLVADLGAALVSPSVTRGGWAYRGCTYEWVLGERRDDGLRLLTLHDVSPYQRRAELWERYRLVSESTHDVVLFIHRDGRILEANEAAALTYGHPRSALSRMNIAELRAPSTRETVLPQMREAFERGVIFETLHLRSDGTTFPVEVSSRSALIGGEPVLLSIIRDLTERNAMQARLVQADRMAAVGTLAAGVAHEINNPLAYAITNLEVLARTLGRIRQNPIAGDFALAEQLLSIAREGADRVRVIVRDLKTFSRADDGQKTAVDVRVVLDSCINMASAELRHRARLVREYDDVPVVEASESRIAQVFLNLLVNAAQSFDATDPQRNEVRVRACVDERGAVVVTVSDNGPGIPAPLRDRLFEPFVTSKPVGEGTGLGLFISRELVTALGGQVDVESEPGRGTRMTVTLPAARPSAGSIAAPPSAASAPPKRTRILVVDDEDSIGTSIRRALADEMAVVVATSAREALALLEEDRAFDAVLCDVVMPEMDGLTLHDRVTELDAPFAARFLFMTGGTLGGETRPALALRRGTVLEKPFTVDELRDALVRHGARR